MNHNGIFSLSFPEAKTIIVSGDIHGNFNQLVFKLCIQYQLTDTLLIVAGNCGFGFEKKEYYEQIVRRNAKRMNQDNNWIVFVRGNHDNPAYFDGAMLNFKRFVAVPDYSILQVCNHTILRVGGAISIDRIYRINEWNRNKYRVHSNESQENDISRNLYWQNEVPVYDPNKMNAIPASFLIDTTRPPKRTKIATQAPCRYRKRAARNSAPRLKTTPSIRSMRTIWKRRALLRA